MSSNWYNHGSIESVNYQCGYCGKDIISDKGYWTDPRVGEKGLIAICHYCNRPTYFDSQSNQYPGSFFGSTVYHIPTKEISELYNEARRCMAVNAYTASILCNRKLLMNIAISKGAEKGLSFQKYVDYLELKGCIPPEGKDCVNHIREKGNEATHEIRMMSQEDAEDLITFTEMLLKFIYEFPYKNGD